MQNMRDRHPVYVASDVHVCVGVQLVARDTFASQRRSEADGEVLPLRTVKRTRFVGPCGLSHAWKARAVVETRVCARYGDVTTILDSGFGRSEHHRQLRRGRYGVRR